jgi:hypothetical protein
MELQLSSSSGLFKSYFTNGTLIPFFHAIVLVTILEEALQMKVVTSPYSGIKGNKIIEVLHFELNRNKKVNH